VNIELILLWIAHIVVGGILIALFLWFIWAAAKSGPVHPSDHDESYYKQRIKMGSPCGPQSWGHAGAHGSADRHSDPHRRLSLDRIIFLHLWALIRRLWRLQISISARNSPHRRKGLPMNFSTVSARNYLAARFSPLGPLGIYKDFNFMVLSKIDT
jgi:hypothetical protein